MSFSGTRTVLIGGATGIGHAVARAVVAAGGSVVLGGRNADRLRDAADALGRQASWRTVDVTDLTSMAEFFEPLDRIDHLFTTGGAYTVGSLLDLDPEQAASPFTAKFWGQYHAVRLAAPKFSDRAAVVLMGGAAGARPPGAAPAYAACNSAIEGLGRGLAVELAPVRVNVVAPGTIDGHLWSQRPAEVREASFARYGRDTLLHRVGTEDEVAAAVTYLFTSTYTTGTVLFPDGGYTLH